MKKHVFSEALWSTATLSWIMYIFSHSSATADESRSASGGITKLLLEIIPTAFEKMSETERISLFSLINAIVRKCAHMAIFFILAALILVLIYSFLGRIRPMTALLFSVALASADEFHQMFVAGRGPAVLDVAIDMSGAALGILLLLVFFVTTYNTTGGEKVEI